jgi:hypothetical protein
MMPARQPPPTFKSPSSALTRGWICFVILLWSLLSLILLFAFRFANIAIPEHPFNVPTSSVVDQLSLVVNKAIGDQYGVTFYFICSSCLTFLLLTVILSRELGIATIRLSHQRSAAQNRSTGICGTTWSIFGECDKIRMHFARGSADAGQGSSGLRLGGGLDSQHELVRFDYVIVWL